VIPAEAVFVVYGGNGRRRLGSFETKYAAEKWAAEFECACWSQGVAVPKSWIEEEK
jgi:hypothetical protein